MSGYHGFRLPKLGTHPEWLSQIYRSCLDAVPHGPQAEVVAVEDAYMRVTGEDVIAARDVPGWPVAARSGYGLRATDVKLDARDGKVALTLVEGLARHYTRLDKPFIDPLPYEHVVDVFLHGALPQTVDTVVPYEADAAPQSVHRKQVWLRHPPRAGSGVIGRASDAATGQILVPKGRRITNELQAVLIAAGVRQLKVVKRPRVGVVVSSYDRCAPSAAMECWQGPDACGPYVRSTFLRWGYDVPAVEYRPPPPCYGLSSAERQAAEDDYRRAVTALSERYDLIIGSGMSASEVWWGKGLNRAAGFFSLGGRAYGIEQRPGESATIGLSNDRSPPYTEVFEFIDEHGRPRGSRSVYHGDRATLVNLPGFLSSVAVLMHVLVRHIVDLYEFVEIPGPYWEIGELACDVECDRKTNLMQWAKIVWGPRGEPLIEPLPVQDLHRIVQFLDAEVIAAIPASAGALAAGSRIHFLRLDPMRQPVAPNFATPVPIEIVAQRHHSTQSQSRPPLMKVSESWSCLDRWLQATPDEIHGGFKPPASEDDIAALQAALGTKLPDDFVASLETHNGQADPDGVCFEGQRLLDINGILDEWNCWRELLETGEFEDLTSDPDKGVKDDWFNLKWISITSDGMGNSLCIDLDPAPEGTVGQVIRLSHDDARRERLADSFEHWLCLMVKGITRWSD